MNISLHLSTSILLLLLSASALTAGSGDTTTSRPVDTLDAPRWGIELRAGLLRNEGTATAELRYISNRWLSFDGLYLTALPAVHLGVSITPWQFLYLQGSVGRPYIREVAVHSMPFDPEFSYAIRGGLRARIGERLTVSIGAGRIDLVDTDFCPICSDTESPESSVEPASTSVRSYDLWEIGIGLTW